MKQLLVWGQCVVWLEWKYLLLRTFLQQHFLIKPELFQLINCGYLQSKCLFSCLSILPVLIIKNNWIHWFNIKLFYNLIHLNIWFQVKQKLRRKLLVLVLSCHSLSCHSFSRSPALVYFPHLDLETHLQ